MDVRAFLFSVLLVCVFAEETDEFEDNFDEVSAERRQFLPTFNQKNANPLVPLLQKSAQKKLMGLLQAQYLQQKNYQPQVYPQPYPQPQPYYEQPLQVPVPVAPLPAYPPDVWAPQNLPRYPNYVPQRVIRPPWQNPIPYTPEQPPHNYQYVPINSYRPQGSYINPFNRPPFPYVPNNPVDTSQENVSPYVPNIPQQKENESESVSQYVPQNLNEPIELDTQQYVPVVEQKTTESLVSNQPYVPQTTVETKSTETQTLPYAPTSPVKVQELQNMSLPQHIPQNSVEENTEHVHPIQKEHKTVESLTTSKEPVVEIPAGIQKESLSSLPEYIPINPPQQEHVPTNLIPLQPTSDHSVIPEEVLDPKKPLASQIFDQIHHGDPKVNQNVPHATEGVNPTEIDPQDLQLLESVPKDHPYYQVLQYALQEKYGNITQLQGTKSENGKPVLRSHSLYEFDKGVLKDFDVDIDPGQFKRQFHNNKLKHEYVVTSVPNESNLKILTLLLKLKPSKYEEQLSHLFNQNMPELGQFPKNIEEEDVQDQIQPQLYSYDEIARSGPVEYAQQPPNPTYHNIYYPQDKRKNVQGVPLPRTDFEIWSQFFKHQNSAPETAGKQVHHFTHTTNIVRVKKPQRTVVKFGLRKGKISENDSTQNNNANTKISNIVTGKTYIDKIITRTGKNRYNVNLKTKQHDTNGLHNDQQSKKYKVPDFLSDQGDFDLRNHVNHVQHQNQNDANIHLITVKTAKTDPNKAHAKFPKYHAPKKNINIVQKFVTHKISHVPTVTTHTKYQINTKNVLTGGHHGSNWDHGNIFVNSHNVARQKQAMTNSNTGKHKWGSKGSVSQPKASFTGFSPVHTNGKYQYDSAYKISYTSPENDNVHQNIGNIHANSTVVHMQNDLDNGTEHAKLLISHINPTVSVTKIQSNKSKNSKRPIVIDILTDSDLTDSKEYVDGSVEYVMDDGDLDHRNLSVIYDLKKTPQNTISKDNTIQVIAIPNEGNHSNEYTVLNPNFEVKAHANITEEKPNNVSIVTERSKPADKYLVLDEHLELPDGENKVKVLEYNGNEINMEKGHQISKLVQVESRPQSKVEYNYQEYQEKPIERGNGLDFPDEDTDHTVIISNENKASPGNGVPFYVIEDPDILINQNPGSKTSLIKTSLHSQPQHTTSPKTAENQVKVIYDYDDHILDTLNKYNASIPEIIQANHTGPDYITIIDNSEEVRSDEDSKFFLHDVELPSEKRTVVLPTEENFSDHTTTNAYENSSDYKWSHEINGLELFDDPKEKYIDTTEIPQVQETAVVNDPEMVSKSGTLQNALEAILDPAHDVVTYFENHSDVTTESQQADLNKSYVKETEEELEPEVVGDDFKLLEGIPTEDTQLMDLYHGDSSGDEINPDKDILKSEDNILSVDVFPAKQTDTTEREKTRTYPDYDNFVTGVPYFLWPNDSRTDASRIVSNDLTDVTVQQAPTKISDSVTNPKPYLEHTLDKLFDGTRLLVPELNGFVKLDYATTENLDGITDSEMDLPNKKIANDLYDFRNKPDDNDAFNTAFNLPKEYSTTTDYVDTVTDSSGYNVANYTEPQVIKIHRPSPKEEIENIYKSIEDDLFILPDVQKYEMKPSYQNFGEISDSSKKPIASDALLDTSSDRSKGSTENYPGHEEVTTDSEKYIFLDNKSIEKSEGTTGTYANGVDGTTDFGKILENYHTSTESSLVKTNVYPADEEFITDSDQSPDGIEKSEGKTEIYPVEEEGTTDFAKNLDDYYTFTERSPGKTEIYPVDEEFITDINEILNHNNKSIQKSEGTTEIYLSEEEGTTYLGINPHNDFMSTERSLVKTDMYPSDEGTTTDTDQSLHTENLIAVNKNVATDDVSTVTHHDTSIESGEMTQIDEGLDHFNKVLNNNLRNKNFTFSTDGYIYVFDDEQNVENTERSETNIGNWNILKPVLFGSDSQEINNAHKQTKDNDKGLTKHDNIEWHPAFNTDALKNIEFVSSTTQNILSETTPEKSTEIRNVFKGNEENFAQGTKKPLLIRSDSHEINKAYDATKDNNTHDNVEWNSPLDTADIKDSGNTIPEITSQEFKQDLGGNETETSVTPHKHYPETTIDMSQNLNSSETITNYTLVRTDEITTQVADTNYTHSQLPVSITDEAYINGLSVDIAPYSPNNSNLTKDCSIKESNIEDLLLMLNQSSIQITNAEDLKQVFDIFQVYNLMKEYQNIGKSSDDNVMANLQQNLQRRIEVLIESSQAIHNENVQNNVLFNFGNDTSDSEIEIEIRKETMAYNIVETITEYVNNIPNLPENVKHSIIGLVFSSVTSELNFNNTIHEDCQTKAVNQLKEDINYLLKRFKDTDHCADDTEINSDDSGHLSMEMIDRLRRHPKGKKVLKRVLKLFDEEESKANAS